MGGSSKPQTTTTTQEIPAFLKPYLTAQANIGTSALGNLNTMLGNAGSQQLVSPFNPNQIAGQNLAISTATSPTGPLAQAQNALGDIAQGAAISRYSPEAIAGMQAGMNAANLGGVDFSQLQRFAESGYQLPQVAQQALDQSAAGGFMYGNPAFDEAVQASIRAARPSILSGFASQGGVGGAKSGLAQIGMQQAASDAFARLFGDERNRQLTATGQIGQFGLQGRQLQQGAAESLTQAQLQQRAQDIQQQQLRNQAAQGFAGVIGDERTRQLQAANQLPGIGLLASDVLRNVGNEQYQLDQRNLTAPIDAQMMLLSALGGFNPAAYTGGTMTQPIYRNQGAGALGGALAGAQLGSVIPGLGTGIGAGLGGLLGLFG